MPSDKLISKCRSHYKIVIPAVCLLFFCIYDLLFFFGNGRVWKFGQKFPKFYCGANVLQLSWQELHFKSFGRMWISKLMLCFEIIKDFSRISYIYGRLPIFWELMYEVYVILLVASFSRLSHLIHISPTIVDFFICS